MQEQTGTDTETTTPPVVENGTAQLPQDLMNADNAFFTQIENLLAKLVPPDHVELTTCTGEKLTLPGTIAARQQVKVFRLMRELIADPAVNEALGAWGGDGGSNIVDGILALATNEVISEKLGEIFTAAYPNALAGQDPLDVLPMEDLITALVPFSERFIKKIGGGIAVLGRNATEIQ